MFGEDSYHIFPRKEVLQIIGRRFRSVTALLVLVSLVALFVTACGDTPTTAPLSNEIQDTTQPEITQETTQPQPEAPTVQPQPQQVTPEPVPTPKPSTDKFVGSAKSDKYHYPSCQWAKRIKPENEVWFSSTQEAGAAGYIPCKVCSPPY